MGVNLHKKLLPYKYCRKRKIFGALYKEEMIVIPGLRVVSLTHLSMIPVFTVVATKLGW